jgi:transglutaminase-like putative cysteine protease
MPSPISLPNLDGQNVYQNSAAAVDLSYISYGFIKVRLVTPSQLRFKVGIVYGGSTYYYDLKNDGSTEVYPLQMGNGSYSITVYQNISGNSYSTVLSTTVPVSLSSSFDPFLLPNQIVNYSGSSQAVAIARQLVSGKTNNYDRISAMLSYVASHISYDYALASTVQSGYVPDIDADLARGKGICYDYAAISAAMLRSQGYPTKLLMGYVENGTVYHAWNEVYIAGSGWVKVMSVTLNTSNWSRVDVTFISTSTSPATIAKYIGNSSNYRTVYTY